MTTRTAELISMADIARMTGQSRSTVGNWKARHSDFPAPASRTSRGALYDRSDVEEWLHRTGRLSSVSRANVSSGAPAPGSASTPLDSSAGATGAVLLTLRAVASRRRCSDLGEPDGLRQWSDLGRLAQAGDIDGVRQMVDSALPFAEGLIDWDAWRGNAAELAALVEEVSTQDAARIPALVDTAVARCALNDNGALQTSPRDFVAIPPAVRLLAVGLLNATAGDVLYQAGPGLGQLAIAAALDAEEPGDLYLQESSSQTAQLAHLNLVAHGLAATVQSGSVLHHDAFPGLRADRVMATPPWEPKTTGLPDTAEDPRWRWGEPGANDGYLAWIQHTLYHLAEGGRAVILLPLNALFDRGHSAVQTRQRIVKAGHIEGVVSLPVGAIPGTTVRGVLMVLSKEDSEMETTMVDMSINPDGTPSPEGVPTSERARHIATIYRDAGMGGMGDPVGLNVATIPDLKELAAHDFILDPGRYQYLGQSTDSYEQMMINFNSMRSKLELLLKSCRTADREIATMFGTNP